MGDNMTDTSGGFRAARGCAPVTPDAELPAAIIRRLRDGIGEDILDMTTDAGDVGRLMTAKQLESFRIAHQPRSVDRRSPKFPKQVCRWCGDVWPCDPSLALAHIDAQSRRLAAYQAATGFLVQQGLCFGTEPMILTDYAVVECIACGEQAGTREAIRHMPDCAAEALRALVAGEGK